MILTLGCSYLLHDKFEYHIIFESSNILSSASGMTLKLHLDFLCFEGINYEAGTLKLKKKFFLKKCRISQFDYIFIYYIK